MLRIESDWNDVSIGDLRRAADILSEGGIGIIPTDTVYGLTALAGEAGAVGRIYELKNRAAGKPLPVQVSGAAEANDIAVADGAEATVLIDEFWPGALTLVLERRQGIELPFQRPDSLGLRMPDCPFCIALIRMAGYVVAPSANLAGVQPPVCVEEVSGEVLEAVDFVVDCGRCPIGIESTVVDLRTGVRILREGAINEESILAAIGSL